MIKSPAMLPLLVALGFTLGAAHAQAQTKKELAAKIVVLQQPAIENLAISLAERPAQMMMNQAGMALQNRVAPDKQEAVAKDIQADVKKYLDDTVPLLKDRATKLGPTTIQPLLEEKFTEDELKQVIVMLESPAIKKYQQLSSDMDTALRTKLIDDTRGTVEPKLTALQQNVAKRLGITAPPAGASAPASAPKAPAKPAPAPKK